ncbi:MAG: outer membrane beta-barrel protein [Bacteroidales bacterium]
MKKLLAFFIMICVPGLLIAGGLVTNTNQSALYTRLQSRNASTSIDAVYFNPAGLTKLGNGIFVSLNNQTIGQTKSVLNNYTYLAGKPKEYIGKVSAPVFPGVYAALKAGKFVVSAGFNPVGGGGGAKYDDGLPSFEMPVSDLVPLLVSQSIPATQYSADIFFEGTSVYFGYQANLSYEINDRVSVAAGVRLVTVKNTYNGYLKNIKINPNYPAFGSSFTGGMVLARDFFTAGATTLSNLSSGATSYSAGLQPIIDAGYGSVLLSNGTSVGLTTDQIAQIQQILGAAGLTPAQIAAATISTSQATLNEAAPVFSSKATAMTGYAAMTQDVEVDAEQTGSGFSPILSMNISPIDNLNISLKYEFKTKLELTTKVNDNKGGGVFTDGEKVIADMPAMLAAGVEFRPIDRLLLTGSINMYFDNDVDYDGSESENIDMIDKNFTEYAFGAEFGLTNNIRVSAGWLGTFTGVNSSYQNDQRYSLNTHSFGGGLGIRILPMLDLNLGGSYTIYTEGSKDFSHMLGTLPVPVTETYNKDTWVVAIGLDLYLGKK